MRPHPFQTRLRAIDPVGRTGRVRSIHSTYVEADGPNVPLGTICSIDARSADGPSSFQAEVVRVGRDSVTLSPLDEAVPTFAGAIVRANSKGPGVSVGRAYLGRIVDALGRPADGAAPPAADAIRPLHGVSTALLDRASPCRPLDTGISAIDALLTLGEGQRAGIFAASGVGKSSLLTQIARQAQADVFVICLVGERGREVESLWNEGLSPEARARTVLVAATSDQSAAMRVRAGSYALAHAEYWRDSGEHVLLLLDSVTRLAMAMREVGLAAGEPPTVRAYTPGVFAAIPKLVERCGALKAGGSITALMTVLSETDDIDDPICELMKSLLDGHILLSRNLAEQGHFPAIDVPRSISRLAGSLLSPPQREASRQIVEWLSLYEQSRALIDAGLHSKGVNPPLDRAIERRSQIMSFLRQPGSVHQDPAMSLAAVKRLAGGS